MASLNLGKVGLLLRGDWDSDTDYAALDVVSHEGYAYAARVSNKNVEPSAETAAYWQPLAESASVLATMLGYKNDAADSATAAAGSATAAATSASSATDALANEAADFSSSKAYAIGDYVIYNNGTHKYLYRFTAAHSAGAWVGTDATQVALADDVSDLKSAYMDDILSTNSILFTYGSLMKASNWSLDSRISPTTGSNNTQTGYARSGYVSFTQPTVFRMLSADYTLCVWAYSGASASSAKYAPYKNYDNRDILLPCNNGAKYFRVAIKKVSGTSMTSSDLETALGNLVTYTYTDTTLSKKAAPADAQTTGDSFMVSSGGMLLNSWISGKAIDTSSSIVDYSNPVSSSYYNCCVLDCQAGDIFTLTGQTSNSSYALWCWCKTDGSRLLHPSVTLSYNQTEIIAPEEATKLIVNVLNSHDYSIIKGRSAISNIDSLYRSSTGMLNLLEYIKKTDASGTGYSFTWDKSGIGCNVQGESTSDITVDIYRNQSALPYGFVPGETYRIILQSENVNLRIVWYDASGNSTELYERKGFRKETITIPNTAYGMYIMLRLYANTEANETIYPFIYHEKSDLEKYAFTQSAISQNGNEDNLIFTFQPKNKTTTEISYTWNLMDMGCAVVGNISATSYTDIYNSKTSLPDNMVAGNSYTIACDSDIVKLRFVWYDSNEDDHLLAMTGGKDPLEITIPSEAYGLSIRLYINTTGVDINETVYTYIYNVMSDFDKKLSKSRLGIGDTEGNNNANLLSVGNSFMSGAVWINGHNDHSYSAFQNAVYGNIALALNVPEVNVTFQLHSSSGIINKNNNKNLVDIIKTYDLSGFDYVLTNMSGTDMTYPLGDINATADDGTIAGAVVSLVEYVTTSNGKCKIILLSVPPYSSDTSKSGEYVFTGNWSNGKNIGDVDALMYAMAKKYHFTFISWQDNPMSYHYMDFADYIGPNEGSRHANSEDTYRAMGEYAAMQMMAVNSPIALKLIAGLS